MLQCSLATNEEMNEWINWYHLPVAQNWYKTGSRICSVIPSAHEQSRAFRGAVNFTPTLRTVLILATQILGGFERPKLAWKDTRFLDFPYDILMQDRPAHAKFKVERTFFLGVWRWRYARISQTTPFFLPHGISAVPAPPALTTNHTISFS